MNAKTYTELQEKHRKEMNKFPIAYAFNDKQLEEALVKLNATLDECVTVWNIGDVVKRTDVPKLKAMLKRHVEETHELLKDEKLAEEAFLYEMDNHEYAISYDADEEILGVFNLSFEKLNEMGLKMAYMRARERHMKNARNWGMI